MHRLDLLKDICQDVDLSVCGPAWSKHAVFSSLAQWSAVWSLLGILPVTVVVTNSHNNNTALSTSALTLCLHTYYKHPYTQLRTVTNEWTNSSGSFSLWFIIMTYTGILSWILTQIFSIWQHVRDCFFIYISINKKLISHHSHSRHNICNYFVDICSAN